MVKRLSVNTALMAISLVIFWAGFYVLTHFWIQAPVYAFALSTALTLNLALVSVLVTGRRNPAEADVKAHPVTESEAVAGSSEEVKNASSQPVFSEDESVSEGSAFTLGAPMFEPPEKAWLKQSEQEPEIHPSAVSSGPARKPVEKQDAEVSSSETQPEMLSQSKTEDHVKPVRSEKKPVSIESAFLRRMNLNTSPETDQEPDQLARFREVCTVLKQANLPVNIWTDQQLTELAKRHLSQDATILEMVRALLPSNIITIDIRQPSQPGVHANLFQRLVALTGKDLDVKFVVSRKKGGDAEIRFEHRNRPVRWRFSEGENGISTAFLREATSWVGKQSNGRFFRFISGNGEFGLIYLNSSVIRQLDLESAVA